MKMYLNLYAVLFIISIFPVCLKESFAQTKPVKRPPSLPINIPPPPNFSNTSSKNGKFQLISAEYYSQDSKPLLYKRLIKLDSSTGQSWVLQSVRKNGIETRRWIPLEKE